MPPNPRRAFKIKELKDASSQDPFIKPQSMVLSKDIDEERREHLKRWITFFRRNPHRFISEYFGIKLYPFQILMIWILQRSELAYIVASRASSKTWLIAVWALTLAVLYPGIKIKVCSKTLKQGGLILSEKLTSLQSNHPNVAREIRNITSNANTYEANFQCGSTIVVVPSSDSARGGRANYTIVEESRIVSKDILEQVIVPMAEVRTPPYRLEPKYSGKEYLEEARISFITSAGYTSENWFQKVKSCIRRMIDGDETANFLALDYLITIFHNIKTMAMIKNETQDMDAVTVQMEYFNIPSGTSGKAYFKPAMFARNLKQAFYPQRELTYNPKKNPYEMKKVDGEIRMLSVDVATRANKVNDNSIIACIRMIPLIGRGYERHLVYMESHKGQHVGVQAKRIKEIFYDFEADYICLDIQNAGISVFDSLSEPTLCEERGITFPALTVVDETFEMKEEARDDLRRNHTRGLNANPVIFAISATAPMNAQIASYFRASLQKKLWRFLIPEGDAEEYLNKSNKEFIASSTDSETTAFFLHPYVQTGLMINECINLDMSLSNGLIKLTEKPGAYKDRYTDLGYANYCITSFFDKDLLTETQDEDDFSQIASLVQAV